jgi:hypothetical protein
MEDAGKTTILRLLGIVAGKAPIPHGVEVMAQDVVIHMDAHTFRGINTWANWISYIRTRNRVEGPDLQIESMVTNEDGTITARGRWRAQRQGEEHFSREIWARYRVVNGKVVEVWTTRTNYSFLVGPLMGNSAGHLLIMLHVFFWAKNSGGTDLSTAVVASPAQTLNPLEESVSV